MNLAWTLTTAMTKPLTLSLAGAMILAELRIMAVIFDSDCSHNPGLLCLTDWLAILTDGGHE